MSRPAEPARLRWPLLGLVVVAFAWRLGLAARTPVPSEDGVNYLWMAQRFAQGDLVTPWSEVFPPLLSLLVAPLCWVAPPFASGQLVLALLGALSVVPIAQLTGLLARDDSRAIVAAGLLAAVPGLPARACAEIYTEPAFCLAIACAAVCALRGAFWRCGAWCGAAFWLRSEALLLPLAFLLLQPKQAWRSVAVAAGAVVLLGLARHGPGQGFDPLPKVDFNWAKANVGGAGGVLADLGALPGAWVEAFGVAGLLALVGLAASRGNRQARPLTLALVLALAVIVAFAVRRRFLVAWWPLVVPFAVLGLLHLRARWRAPLLAVAVGVGIFTGLRTTDQNRIAEREVALWAQAQLQPGECIASDLTRVLWFAGQRPLPPRHLTAAEIVAQAREPGVRFLVLGGNRTTAPEVRAALPEFRLLALPVEIADLAADRGVEVRGR